MCCVNMGELYIENKHACTLNYQSIYEEFALKIATEG